MSDRKQDFNMYLKDNSEWPKPVKREVAEYLSKKEGYRAIERFKTGDKVTERFRIVDKDGNFDAYSYTHLTEITYRSGLLTLTTTRRNFVISGKNLQEIADLLCERKVRAIYEFNPSTYEEPEDEKATIIEMIERWEE